MHCEKKKLCKSKSHGTQRNSGDIYFNIPIKYLQKIQRTKWIASFTHAFNSTVSCVQYAVECIPLHRNADFFLIFVYIFVWPSVTVFLVFVDSVVFSFLVQFHMSLGCMPRPAMYTQFIGSPVFRSSHENLLSFHKCSWRHFLVYFQFGFCHRLCWHPRSIYSLIHHI